MSQKAEIPFLTQNLRSGEEILYTARPPRRKQIALSFFKNTVIPFPFAWLWGFIDLAVLVGVPIGMAGTKDAYVIAFIVPFILVHATPFWIYLYNVIANIRDAKSRGYILTSERILFRMERKKPFTSVELRQIETVQVTNTSKISWLNIHIAMKPNFNKNAEKNIDITGLGKTDVESMYELLEAILSQFRRQENKVKYRASCVSCGGRTEDGYCLYCGTRAELRSDADDKKTRSEKKAPAEAKEKEKTQQERKKKIEEKIRQIQKENNQTVSDLIENSKRKK